MVNFIRSLLVLFSLTFIISCQSEKSPTAPEPIDANAQWLKENAIPLTTNDPEVEDFSDLQPLKTVIGDAQVVMLGEQSHGDGGTFLMKTRLIKFLHQEMRFDVMAFESGLYSCHKIEDGIARGNFPTKAIREAIFSIWTGSEQFQHLVHFLSDTREQPRPLEIVGFDCQFSGSYSARFFLEDLLKFLEPMNYDSTKLPYWNEFKYYTQKLSNHDYFRESPPDTAARNRYFHTLAQIQQDVTTNAELSGEPNYGLWCQILKSYYSEVTKTWSHDYTTNQPMAIETIKMRDIQMGENLVWLVNSYLPGRKFMVWAANTHISRNIQLAQYPQSPGLYDDYITMGQVVHEKLGDRAYSLCVTSNKGYYGYYWQFPTMIQMPPRGSIEYYFNQTGFYFAIIDFRNMNSGGNWLRQTLSARPFGHGDMLADWTQIMDGLLYLEKMTPSTRAE